MVGGNFNLVFWYNNMEAYSFGAMPILECGMVILYRDLLIIPFNSSYFYMGIGIIIKVKQGYRRCNYTA